MNRNNFSPGFLLMIFFVFLLSAYGKATQQFEKALAADSNLIHASIMQANEKFGEAVNKQDAEAIAALYTSDGRLLPAGSGPVEGRAEIGKFWKGVMASGITGAKLETREVYAGEDGKTATELGSYQLMAGDKMADEGKYVVIWKLTPEGWQLHRDIWTTNHTPKP